MSTPIHMTGKERIRVTMAHREPDRVPMWELGFHNAVASRIMGRPTLLSVGGGQTELAVLQANLQGPDARRAMIARIVDDTMCFYRHMGYNLVRLRPTDFLCPFAFGSGNWPPQALWDSTMVETEPHSWRIAHREGFWSVHRYIPERATMCDVDDSIRQEGLTGLERYVACLEGRHIDLSAPPLRDALEGIRQAVIHPAAADIFVLGWGDVCFPSGTAHQVLFLEAMASAPALVERYMEVTTQGVLALVRAQVALGVDGITGGNDWAFKTGPMFSTDHLRRFIAPYLKRIVEEAHRGGVPYIKHGDGNLNAHLPVLVDDVGIDGLHSIEPAAGMDIAALKRQYGDRVTLMGNLDCDLLVRGAPHDIRAAVRQLMEQVAPGGGYVFSTANSVLYDVPPPNLDAMLEAVGAYGRYPIGSHA